MNQTHRDGQTFPGGLTPAQIAQTPVLVRGEGVYVYDRAGKRYLDAIAGIAVVSVGHGRTEVAEAMARQARELAYCMANVFANEPSQALARRVAALAPGDLNQVFFTSGGSEAVETAIKLARQYHLETGQPERYLVIARRQSYHGATLGALSATGMAGRRAKYLPLLLDFPHIAPAYCYRCPFNKTYPGCDLDCAQELEETIRRVGPERVSAFIAEPVVGAAGGATAPPAEYFPRVREICSRYGVLFIADEVITGMGRTGKNFGIEHWGVAPDMMTLAKSLSGGYSPLGAVVASDKIRQAFQEKGSAFDHIFTYAANPLSTATALAVLDIIVKEDLVNRAARMGQVLFREAGALLEHPIVGDVRGKGLLLGVELVQDKATKATFPVEWKVNKRLAAMALERGLVIYPGSGCADGARGDHFLICPPYVIHEKEIDELVGALDASLARLEQEL
jgi:adenosylmethionine-8-amino-7-oxononanoate aminotransferase